MDKMMRKIDALITTFIPKNTRCRFEEQKNEMKREGEKRHIMAQIEKVENPAKVQLSVEWVEVQPDMSVCSVCKEVAYNHPHKLVIKFNGEVINTKRTVIMCNPCLELSK